MKNITLLLWMMLGTFAFIECSKYEWKYEPWYGKDFHEQWAKIPETSDDESSEEEESEDSSDDTESDSGPEYAFDFTSDLYEDEPDTWACLYKDCRGKEQSPINIDTEAITTDENLGPLTFENYDTPLSDLLIENAGFTTGILVPLSANVSVTSEWLGTKYNLFAISFSYTSSNKNGSLHTVDSQYYPLEVTLYHLNSKYDKFEYEPDAVLHLTILFQIGKENKAIKNITESLGDIKELDSNTTLKSPVTLQDLLPKFPEHYITYNGSLLIPSCTEGQKYIVFQYSNTVSKKQMEKFRQLETMKNGRDLGEEVRPIQPLNHRKILSSKNGQEQKDWWYEQSSQQYWK